MPLLSRGLRTGLDHRWTILIVLAVCVLPVFVFAQQVFAQQAPDDPESVLRRTRERLLADLDRFPRYTCVQTITRQYYLPHSQGASCATLMDEHKNPPGKLRLRGWDRLRLEVAIVGRENVYSWVGAPRFESGMLEQLAGRGPFNTGDFGPYLHSIFGRAEVNFEGEESSGQKRLLAYSYAVPLALSTYQVRTGDGWTPTAYSGTFRLDPQTSDIVRMTVRTAELPEANPDCQAISEIEYGRTQIHDRMVLIPRQTSLFTMGRDGSDTQSLTTYAGCREYASRTRMLIDPSSVSSTADAVGKAGSPAGVAAAGLPARGATLNDAQLLPRSSSSPPSSPSSSLAAPASLPAGLHLNVRIVTPIDSDTAAAGDPVEAVLRSPVRDKHHQELAPAGTRLHGRLLDLEQRTGWNDYFRVSIEFESIEIKGQAVALRAIPDLSVLSSSRPSMSVSANDADTDGRVFIFRTEHLRREKFDWSWTTLPVGAKENKKEKSEGDD